MFRSVLLAGSAFTAYSAQAQSAGDIPADESGAVQHGAQGGIWPR
ncbi:hypothetical protein [Rhizorhabdus argentea]